jgi:hypothetical protein
MILKITRRWLLLCLCCMQAGCAFAQAPEAPAVTASVRTVALAPDTCPVVHLGDTVMLDWNPGYDPAWPVSSVDGFILKMKRQPYVTHGYLDMPLVLWTPLPLHPFPALANGFFHIEMKVRERRASGEYYIVSAEDRPHLSSDYSGPRPRMTHSPADARFCVNYQDTGVPPRLPNHDR